MIIIVTFVMIFNGVFNFELWLNNKNKIKRSKFKNLIKLNWMIK